VADVNRNTELRWKVEQRDIEQIKAIIANKAERFKTKAGDVTFAGIEGGTVKIAPAGFCWR
jgi:hypothetical protein